MILMAGYYHDPDADRGREFWECIQRNHANESLEEICLWIEGSFAQGELLSFLGALAAPKLWLISHGRRLTYRELFSFANRHLVGRRVAISNADIFFDESLEALANCDLCGQLLCLSRWDVLPDGSARLFEHPCSQDAWVFDAPIREFPCDFHLGVPGCDNRLAAEAQQAGLKISNPARSVRACHLHLSGVRRYSECERLTGQGCAVPAGSLEPCGAGTTAQAPARCTEEPMYAVTSLSTARWRDPVQQASIRSWREAGLRVCSLNHPSEIASLSPLYDVDWIPATVTSSPIFGQHYIPIDLALKWAARRDAPVLLINSDIELRLAEWEMKRLRWLSDGGLCYCVRHNYDGDPSQASREPFGIDAFLLHGRDADLVPASFLSIGQPFWDYLLLHSFAAQGRRLHAVEFPAAFHQVHSLQWCWEAWHRCALEFDRATRVLGSDCSMEACLEMSWRVREAFEREKVSLSARPPVIREWVERRFGSEGRKVFLELGSHCGTDTAWMAALEGVQIHAFEPDPRNRQVARANVIPHRAAIADRDGRAPFILSQLGWGQEWTHSSSLKTPKNHLSRFPVTFGETIEVETVTLDSFHRKQGLGDIDFIWADIQGAEREMIRGGQECLAHTRYLFTEYSDDELYEDQATLREILDMLPGFRVLELWPEDILLENRRFAG